MDRGYVGRPADKKVAGQGDAAEGKRKVGVGQVGEGRDRDAGEGKRQGGVVSSAGARGPWVGAGLTAVTTGVAPLLAWERCMCKGAVVGAATVAGDEQETGRESAVTSRGVAF